MGLVGTTVSWRGSVGGQAHSVLDIQNFTTEARKADYHDIAQSSSAISSTFKAIQQVCRLFLVL